MDEEKFSRPAGELSCVIGNLFVGLNPPCGLCADDAIVVCGKTQSGRDGRLVIERDRCTFYGDIRDLEMVLDGRCPERRCRDGRQGVFARE